ncbi:TIM barrel protein [Salinispora cortesiana]|uniref:TIM barrel protein n=1 Tax=Salinispora cortesiana TaxID=1305843 RepID=UPI0004170D2F|nr:TIM barrel protein [Salinispora cortesiana]
MSIKQCFAWWSFAAAPQQAPDLLRQAAAIGCQGVEFLPRDRWQEAYDLGLQLTVIDGHECVEVGFSDRANHRALADEVRRNLEVATAGGVLNLAVASGNWSGPPHDGISICAEGLAPLAAEAEAAHVGLLLEPLNSKVDHVGHECDSTAWAAAVVERVGSPALRMLYDMYHMQIMEGDLIRTIREKFSFIGHVHVAGVPGRAELDDRQEVNWQAIAATLREHGYPGYVTHEFIPRGDPVAALRQAFQVFAQPAVEAARS